MNNPLDERRKWFDAYCSQVDKGTIKPQTPGISYTCPCCGYPTLPERGGYEICYLCSWEDDGQDDPHADEVWGGPNGRYSLSMGRDNFKDHLNQYDAKDSRNNDNPNEVKAKEAIISAFENLRSETASSKSANLFESVENNKRILRNELHKRVEKLDREAKEKKKR